MCVAFPAGPGGAHRKHLGRGRLAFITALRAGDLPHLPHVGGLGKARGSSESGPPARARAAPGLRACLWGSITGHPSNLRASGSSSVKWGNDRTTCPLLLWLCCGGCAGNKITFENAQDFAWYGGSARGGCQSGVSPARAAGTLILALSSDA